MSTRTIILVPDFQGDTVLGLDCSSKTMGWGLLSKDFKLIAHGHFSPLPSKHHFMARLSGVYDQISNICNQFTPKEIAVEDIIQHMSGGGSMAQTITILAAFNRVAALAAWCSTKQLEFYPVATIRKIIRTHIHRKEKIGKEEMPSIIRDNLCAEFADILSKKGSVSEVTMDEADGIAVAWAHLIGEK